MKLNIKGMIQPKGLEGVNTSKGKIESLTESMREPKNTGRYTDQERIKKY